MESGNSQNPQGTTPQAVVPRAGRPVAPPLSRAAKREALDRRGRLVGLELQERRSMLRGLLLLAVVVAIVALLHFGTVYAFPPGWWKRW